MCAPSVRAVNHSPHGYPPPHQPPSPPAWNPPPPAVDLPPSPPPPPPRESPAVKIVVGVAVAVCVLALLGIAAVYTVRAASSDSGEDRTDTGAPNQQQPTGNGGVARKRGKPGTAVHTKPADLCAPMRTVTMDPPLTTYEPSEGTALDGSLSFCRGEDEHAESDAEIGIWVHADSGSRTAAAEALQQHESTRREYGAEREVEELTGLGDAAVAAARTDSADPSMAVCVVHGNLWLDINVYSADDKDGAVEVGKRLAKAYLEASAA
jgi:hypothetical protein